MHLLNKTVVALIFVAAAGCGGSTPNPKSGGEAGGGATESGAADGKQAECSSIKKKLDEIDEAVKGQKGMAAGRALTPALEKMSKELRESPPKTPGLDKATAELVTEADSFAAKLKEMNAVFEEMEKINVSLETWQKNVEKAAEDFDAACAKAPKDECEAMSKRVTQIPHLEGNDFGKYANDLDTFVKSMNDSEVKNAGLKVALKKMLAVLSEAGKPFRRLDELMAEPKKLDPAAGQMKAKFNQVREICGIPVR